MAKLLYLCSLPHSGSTLLSLFLGGHSRLISLGGIDRSVSLLCDPKEAARLECTCGSPALECRYWSEVAKRLRGKPRLPERYQIALEAFGSVFGDEVWPMDSSKHVEPLRELASEENLTLRAIHLIKDVRTLTTSFIDRARRTKAHPRPGPVLALEYFWKWRRENRKIETCLETRGVEFRRVGYEELCLAPDTITARISEWLGLPVESVSPSLRQSGSHLIAGNRMRKQEEKQSLRYDHRWFSRREWLLAAVLFPQIMKYNSEAVYSNQADALWKQ